MADLDVRVVGDARTYGQVVANLQHQLDEIGKEFVGD